MLINNNMNKSITAKIESLSESQLKAILCNAMADPTVETTVFDAFAFALEKYPLESVMSFTHLLVAYKTITEESWHEAICYYLYPMHIGQSASDFQLINCGFIPRIKSVVYCILCGIEDENAKKG